MQSDSLLKNYHHSIFEKMPRKGKRKDYQSEFSQCAVHLLENESKEFNS